MKHHCYNLLKHLLTPNIDPSFQKLSVAGVVGLLLDVLTYLKQITKLKLTISMWKYKRRQGFTPWRISNRDRPIREEDRLPS